MRGLGQRPSVVDDPSRWALARRAVNGDSNVVAFVGTSRMELALSLSTAAAMLPGKRPIQLAINGMPALEVLADLASDDQFRGLAVVDLDEWDIATDDHSGSKPFIDRSHRLWRAPGAVANRLLATWPQEHLASLAIGGRSLLARLARGRTPQATWVVTDRDRVGYGDYSLAEPAALRAKARARLANFDVPGLLVEQWLERAASFEMHARTIRARGGDVVFVRLPISGVLEDGFEKQYPKALYWDVFARLDPGRVLHYRDIPSMRDLECPDEMHLDQRDKAAFTQALVEAVSASVEQRHPQ